MGIVSQKIRLAMEFVRKVCFYVEKCADQMMEIGEHVTENVFIRQQLVMECVQWTAIFVATVQDA